MSVLRNLMAVGVSGAITLINVGPGTAVPSPIDSQDNSSNSNTTQPQEFKQNPQDSYPTAPIEAEANLDSFSPKATDSPEKTSDAVPLDLTLDKNPQKGQQISVSTSELPHQNPATSVSPSMESRVAAQGSLPLEILTSTFKQNPTKSQPMAASSHRLIENFSTPKSSGVSESPTPVFKQNPTKTPEQSVSPSTASTVAPTTSEQPTVTQPSATSTSNTTGSGDSTQTPTPSQTPNFNLPHPLSNHSLSAESNTPLQVETALPNASTQAATLTSPLLPSSDRGKQSQPTQLAQVSTPALTVPDLTPPTTPFPPPTPNGTLQTNPPAILFPSPNPLYRPTLPDQVNIEETVPVTLQQAIDLAIRNNENVSIAQLQVEQNLAALRETQADLYPSLIFRSSFGRTVSALQDLQVRARNRAIRVQRFNNPEQADQLPFQTFYGSFSFDNSLQLQYDLGINGLRGSRIRASEEQLRIFELRLETAIEEVRFDVARAYYNLQEADAAVEIQAAAVRNSQKSLEDAEALERAGVGTRFEVLQARVTLANAQQDLTNSRRNQLQSRRELAAILNIDENSNLLAADPIALAGAWDLTLEDTIVQAYNNRAELEEQLAERDRAQQLRRAALAATRPNVTLAASYNVLGFINDDPSYTANQGWADGYEAQVQFSWNFFDGGAAKAQARQRELDIGIADERFDQLLNQIRLDVERSYYDLQANFDNIQTASLGVEEATEALRLARLRFQAGVGTQLEVINQETDLTRAQNRLLNAIIGYNRALSSLQRAVSNLPGNILSDYPL
ncbi:TolC family protein [Planktothrix mougeotii]|uniref:TolC family protein n=1 Tax=Planktothrix mougeotii LEGE 06226 TaxID=1828728 RepID=A0ABR9UIV2_9CYAN|nr:TolC family protein [Planktothrix mougeotii]MBE9146393.1 TolC family protein [Planktothrix mougeotii LEGE 06226]